VKEGCDNLAEWKATCSWEMKKQRIDVNNMIATNSWDWEMGKQRVDLNNTTATGS
jgi:hypothetical protein